MLEMGEPDAGYKRLDVTGREINVGSTGRQRNRGVGRLQQEAVIRWGLSKGGLQFKK